MNPKYAQHLLTLHNTKHLSLISQAYQQINQCYNELKQLNKKSMQQKDTLSAEDKIFLNGKMVVKIDTIYRLKRFLLVCHDGRCGRVQEQFWSFGGEMRKSQLPNLHQKQKKYLLEYKNIMNAYIDDIGLELTMNLEPPLDTIVEIRVLRDCGEIVEEGITLEKNSVHFIKKRLVEKFIQTGDVVVVK